MLGCGGGEPVVVDGAATPEDVPDSLADLAADTGTDLAQELTFTDVGPDSPDGWEEDTGLACQPGEGCFLDKCAEHDECLSGWCVEHLGEKVCTVACQDECPPGWSCQQVAGTAPDLVFVCVSNHANLCRPCAETDDCQSAVGTEDVCVDYGESGSFCGGACLSDGECPWGFSCGETLTVDGISTKQCVADAGVCPCTATSVALSLWTPCEVTNELGTCAGKRVCTEAGLTDCDAATPVNEECDGEDNDCDGQVDEGTCDDGNPCTADSCAAADGCVNEPLHGGECMDKNPCTVADHCDQGVCVGQLVDCDDKNPCTDDSCDPTGGCIFVDNDVTCDDGDACTVADRCEAGVCSGVAVNCDCQADADCAGLEDGNLCNGTLVCAKEKLPYLCQVEADTIVECPDPEGADADCLAASCNPATGACSFVPANEGKACDDGDLCTLGDTCAEGSCVGGPPATCNDGNSCTDDACDSGQGCIHTPNAAPCSDGDVCTVGDLCGEGECQPGDPLACDDGNPCTTDTCNSATGCVHGNSNAECDDGNACTVGDQCVGGVCKPGNELLSCDDGNVCTTDACLPVSGCTYKLNSNPCNDGNLCTTSDQCQLGECKGGAPLTCTDGNVCTDDSCQPGAGCQFVPNAAACDDGNACTQGDHCEAGSCKATATLVCDDSNPCTLDGCDPAGGCTHTPVDGPCDDGDLCTVNDLCEQGECTGGAPLDCDDGNLCTEDACGGDVGCLHTPLSELACNDNNPCTAVDACDAGVCVGSGEVDCDDGNVCTDDACDPAKGCVHATNSAACNDGNACTLVDTCVNGSCLGTGTPDCDDANPCTEDACVPPGGCQNTPVIPCCGDGQVDPPEECDDGNTAGGDGCDESCMEETAVTMQWTDPQTGSCDGKIWQTMQQIVDAMPTQPVNVEIVAKQVAPGVAGYGDWSATFNQTTCVRQWLKAIADQNVSTYNNWDPAVCQATSTQGDSFFFVCKNDGGGGRQIAIYPVGAQAGQYMKIYMIDRTGPWCDLIGVNSRPGYEDPHVNSNTSGVAGDYLKFTWWF